MKCIACDHEFNEEASCPCCGFPVYEVIGADYEDGRKQVEELAKLHRSQYLRKLRFGFVTYRWKADGDKVVEAGHAASLYTNGEALEKGEAWFESDFARIPKKESIPVTLVVKKGDSNETITVQVPNLSDAELQQVGLCLDEKLHVRVLLKNRYNRTQSEPVSVAIGR